MPHAAPADRSCGGISQCSRVSGQQKGPLLREVSGQPRSRLPTLLLLGPQPCPPPTSVALIHADVEVAAKGGGIDDAIGNLVVGWRVFICCLEEDGQGPVSPQWPGPKEGGSEGGLVPLGAPFLGDPDPPCLSAGGCCLAHSRHLACWGVELPWGI